MRAGGVENIDFHWFFKVFGVWEVENIDFSFVFKGFLRFLGAPGATDKKKKKRKKIKGFRALTTRGVRE